MQAEKADKALAALDLPKKPAKAGGADRPGSKEVRRHGLTAAVPMENPYCSCVSRPYSCRPYGESLLQL